VHLVEKRMRVVRDVARYKEERGMPVLQPAREKIVLDKAASRLTDPAYSSAIRTVFETLMAVSRASQHQQIDRPVEKKCISMEEIVLFPGDKGSFSEQAAIAWFGEKANIGHVPTFEEAARAVLEGRAAACILPIENSTAGSVADTYDLISKYELRIIGEKYVQVEHNLLGIPGAQLSDIHTVISHPQALMQSAEYLAAHPEWEQISHRNTALAAKKIAEDGDRHVAAIASRRAAQVNGLEILAGGIQTVEKNYTRFVVLARNPVESGNKASILFSVAHRVGALSEMINCFARHRLNMTKLESRPIRDRAWEYIFYMDFDYDGNQEELDKAMQEARQYAGIFHLLGVYERGAQK